MTKREKKEKAIREKAISTLSTIVCGGCGACVGCFAKKGWENLYDCIIHKEEEAQKKTAKEILQAWYNENKAKGEEQDFVLELAEKFGVEVEE